MKCKSKDSKKYYPTLRRGELEVYCGPMKSGKTDIILHRAERIELIPGIELICFSPDIDVREPVIKSRFGERSLSTTKISFQKPQKSLDYITDKHVTVIFDEAQFFEEPLLKLIDYLLHENKHVIAAGLDMDFRGEPFGMMPQILAKADYIEKLYGNCEYKGCGQKATRTQRLIDGKPAPYNSPIIKVGDTEIIGAKNESYQVRCFKHHFVPGKP